MLMLLMLLMLSRELEVRAISLDELMVHPDQPNREWVVDFETKTLRDTRDVIHSQGLNVGYSVVDKSPHPRLWKLLAHVRFLCSALDAIAVDIANLAHFRLTGFSCAFR